MPRMPLRRPLAALIVAGVVGALLALTPMSAASALPNPLIGDGSVYSADPATLVVGDTLYVYTGRDEADPTTNDFVMNEWQAFSTTDVEKGSWDFHPSLMRPEQVFAWATPGRAYAGQVVQGADGRFYWYVPVHEAGSASVDPFGIGVAVSDSPLGPWTDHAGGPIVSQRILGNDAHNIDPTVLVDDDGRVWMYWGSFGRLLATEIAPDMKTLIGSPTAVTSGVDGFFEAAWLFARAGTYYLAYAANTAGPDSWCTPAVYHACIGYSTASSPLGPWTFQGRILAPVSSTTSHPAITPFQGEWYLAYHTADAVGGNHFRRSVAVDRLEWDDSTTPARIRPVVTTPDRSVDPTPRANIAPWATASASNQPLPAQYWIAALNDGITRPNPLPPDMWGSYSGDRPAGQWIQYDWPEPVRIDRSAIQFWSDREPGSGDGVSVPASWTLQYWDRGKWTDVPGASGYPTSARQLHEVTFSPVVTTRLRAVLDAAPATADPTRYSALAVEEWSVDAVAADGYDRVATSTLAGEAPELPGTVALAYGPDRVAAPVRWDAVDPASYRSPGSFTVRGTAQGYAAGRVEATVTVVGADSWRTNLARTGRAVAEYTAPGNTVGALSDGVVRYEGDPQAEVWATRSDQRPPSRWAGYEWDSPVTVDAVTAHFWSDRAASSGSGDGVAVPAGWRVQALVDGGWRDVQGVGDYTTARTSPNRVSFERVTTTGIRVVLDAQSDGTTSAAVGLSELEVLGEPVDVTAPVLDVSARGPQGGDGWFVGPVTVRASATDDRDLRTALSVAVDGGAWATTPDVRQVDTVVSGDGAHRVAARAADAAGNVSAEESVDLRIDATAPAVSGSVDAAARSVTASATDAVSGLAATEYAVDDPRAWSPYTGAVTAPDLERHVVYVRARDVAGNVSTPVAFTVPRSPDAPMTGNLARYATPSASYASGWAPVGAVNDGALTGSSWATWPRVGEQWVQLTWDRAVRLDRAGVQFARDAADEQNAGLIPPRSWALQYRDDAGAWRDVRTDGAYGRSSDAINEVRFDVVRTTALRALLQSWGAVEGQGSNAVGEFQAWAAGPAPDTTAPTLAFAPVGAPDAGGWYRGAARFEGSATDDTDPSSAVRVRVDGGAWEPFDHAFAVRADGTHLVEAEAVDAAGNVSTRVAVTVRVDTVAPQVSARVSQDAGRRHVAFTAADGQSGVAAIERRVDGTWAALAGAELWLDGGQGVVDVVFRATDVAGNASVAQTVSVDTGTAPEGDPAVALGAGRVSAGASLAVEGTGFRPGELVTVVLHSDPVRLGAFRADDRGAVRGTVSIPTSAPAGAHTVELRGESSGATASAPLEILASGAPGTPGAPAGTPVLVGAPAAVGGRALPPTGTPAPVIAVLLGTVAVLSGFALALSRRRREHP